MGRGPHLALEGDVLKVASLSVNGASVESKRKDVMEGVKKGTRFNWSARKSRERMWCGVMECLGGSECETWEGMEG